MRRKKKTDMTEFLMGPGWKIHTQDARETVFINLKYPALIRVRHGAAYTANPVVLERPEQSKAYFKFVPQALKALP